MQTFSTAKENPASNAKQIFSLIKDEMALVETEFKNQASSNIQVVNFLGEYLRASGGKRIRPALLILANNAVGGDASSENVIRLATVMEMLHTATLVHDDIIDNANTRRNQASINAKAGNQTAVLMGDWLYMSAFENSLQEKNLEILNILTRLTRKMTEGELIQLTVLGQTDITEEVYFDILLRKTAYLFSACCEIGAILGDASKEEQNALSSFGKNLGIAFQLADDLLDFTSEKEILGKAAGADLLEGKLTLPLIDLVKKEPEYKNKLEKIIKEGKYYNGTRESLYNTLILDGHLQKTREKAYHFASSAIFNLEILPQTEYRLAMEEIPPLMIDRKK